MLNIGIQIKVLFGLFLIIVCLLLFNYWWGEKGVDYFADANERLRNIQSNNEKLLNTNQELRGYIKELRENDQMYESIARKKIGMIKENEVFIRVLE